MRLSLRLSLRVRLRVRLRRVHKATKMNNGQREVIHTHHKEESQARIQND